MIRLIGLVGRARAGKDTVAARLVEAHGFRRYAFADALRRAALALDPLIIPIGTVANSLRLSDVVEAVGWEEAKGHAEVRRTLQRFGVGIREIDPSFWVRIVLDDVDNETRPVVITDVRFTNEAEAVTAAGGVLWRVTRPGLDESDTHVSETELADYPTACRIDNSADLASLAAKVDEALAAM